MGRHLVINVNHQFVAGLWLLFSPLPGERPGQLESDVHYDKDFYIHQFPWQQHRQDGDGDGKGPEYCQCRSETTRKWSLTTSCPLLKHILGRPSIRPWSSVICLRGEVCMDIATHLNDSPCRDMTREWCEYESPTVEAPPIDYSYPPRPLLTVTWWQGTSGPQYEPLIDFWSDITEISSIICVWY